MTAICGGYVTGPYGTRGLCDRSRNHSGPCTPQWPLGSADRQHADELEQILAEVLLDRLVADGRFGRRNLDAERRALASQLDRLSALLDSDMDWSTKRSALLWAASSIVGWVHRTESDLRDRRIEALSAEEELCAP